MGKSDFTKAKRYTYFHIEHTSTFDGNETQHVKGNFVASVDGNCETKADIIIQNGPVAMRSTASIDGDVKIGGNLSVTGSVIVVASVLHKGDNVFGDEASDKQKLIGTTTASGPIIVKTTASINGNVAVGGTVDGVDLAALQANVTDSNASISNLRTNMINVNASVDALQTNIINANASIGDDKTNITRANASIDALQTNVANSNASIGRNMASIIGHNTNFINANASINSINALNLIKSIKTTISYSQLTATSPAQAVPLFRASPGDTIIDQVANLTASFGLDGAMQRTLVSMGDAGDPDGFGKSIGLGTPTGWQWTGNTTYVKGEYLFNASPFYRKHKTYATATLINAVFTASNMWLASFNHGSIDFYVDVMSRG